MKLYFFSKGLSHDFRQKLQISSLFFFDSISLEIMSDDHLVKKIQIWISCSHDTEFFSSGWAMTFVKNWKSHSLFFEQNGLWKMFDDRQVRKQALLDYWDFFQLGNPWFWSKIENWLFLLFWTKYAKKYCLFFMK